jgi:hypothetical protein
MFLKVVFKGTRAKGDRVMHFRMVESYRQGNTVRHQNIYHLGTLPELTEYDYLSWSVYKICKTHRARSHRWYK